MAVAHAHDIHRPDDVFEQFEDYNQQQDSYVIGMWTFLVTEIMFFGGLVLAYCVYRYAYQPQFYLIHEDLDWVKGMINTIILLLSSFMVALAVHFAQKKKTQLQLACMSVTGLCALGFLTVKYIEYTEKIGHHHFPGANFHYVKAGVSARVAELFYSLYFAMTGLHAIHVVGGFLALAIIFFKTVRKHKSMENYVFLELFGLYWHFVDIVWIFLYPMFYLMPR